MNKEQANKLLEICKALDDIVDNQLDHLWDEIQFPKNFEPLPHPDDDDFLDGPNLEMDAWELTRTIARMRDRANRYISEKENKLCKEEEKDPLDTKQTE
jgi:hypothetical protein